MASPESKGIWGQRAIAGVEGVASIGSLINAVKTLIQGGISGSVAIWGAVGILLGIDAKNRWAKTNKK
ncbi:MAG TPA: hypothetical protein VLG12_03160 [Candidatus Saccharimonadales bacterium]|nr:hypothetical protein [Candidatus Saccharimonadales bacterium]